MNNESDRITDFMPKAGWPRVMAGFLLLVLGSWVIMGLAAARVSFDSGVLSDIFWTEILVVFWIGLATISLRISNTAKDNPSRSPVAPYLPPLCSAITLPGIALLIVFLWVGFDEASQTILRMTYSFLALGLAGAYCSVIGLGRIPARWRPLRWFLYVIAAVGAIESLEALWLHGEISTEGTLTEGFGQVGVAFIVALLAYFILAGILYSILKETQARQQIFVVMVYLTAALIGFTFGVIALSDEFDPGPFRLILASTVLLATVTPLLIVFHWWPESVNTDATPTTTYIRE
ncbi:MAG: hypothetical protein VYD09_06230 [Chloroflexota bacterium]|nr:hypothetical protein [Chloroflexota bacterium]